MTLAFHIFSVLFGEILCISTSSPFGPLRTPSEYFSRKSTKKYLPKMIRTFFVWNFEDFHSFGPNAHLGVHDLLTGVSPTLVITLGKLATYVLWQRGKHVLALILKDKPIF